LGGADLRFVNAASANLSNAGLGSTNLQFANFASANFTGASLAGADLRGASFNQATLTSANLSGAQFDGANFASASMASINLAGSDLKGANFALADLSSANFSGASLIGANFAGTRMYSVNFAGFDLGNVNLGSADLSGASLAGANLTGAVVNGANLTRTGLTAQQLYSTASYKAHDLRGIGLYSVVGSDWDLTDQNIAGADFGSTALTWFQLSHTASFQEQDLHGIGLSANNLSGWDLSAQNLTVANLTSATLTNTNFSAADLRGAIGINVIATSTITNTILPAGNINGLNLGDGQSLVIRDFAGKPSGTPGSLIAVPVKINTAMNMSAGSTLNLILMDGTWGSTISFTGNTPVSLGGTLKLDVDPAANIPSLIDTPMQLFKWTTPPAADNHFDQIDADNRFVWDTTGLYSAGVVEVLHLYGDVDDSGDVDVSDLERVAQNWQLGSHPGDPVPAWSDGDFNGDGIVNVNDLRILASNWGLGVGANTSTPSLAPLLLSLDLPDVSIPEPVALLPLCGLFMLARRRRISRAIA
jgi:uncharacterized protein YjbI with pentapeptide repeats